MKLLNLKVLNQDTSTSKLAVNQDSIQEVMIKSQGNNKFVVLLTLLSGRTYHLVGDSGETSFPAYQDAENFITNLGFSVGPVISDLNNSYSKDEIDNMIGDIESVLDVILGV